MRHSIGLLASSALLITGCGGGGGSGSSPAPAPVASAPAPAPAPTPSPTCSLASRQAFARDVIDEWYLFPELVVTSANPASFTTVQGYIDALTATARQQGKDRFFTFITSIAEENAFLASGESAGIGIRLAIDGPARRVLISEAFEGAPGLAAGIDRGDEITAIGTSSASLRTVSDIIAAEGSAGITNALGPNTAGLTRVLRISRNGSSREVSLTKAVFDLPAVSSRYGSRIIQDGNRQIGYINLRTFISSADTPLRNAFSSFRAAGITEFIIDFRYNGGGLISTAELMGDLLGGNRTSSDLYSGVRYRASKSSRDENVFFTPRAESVSPVKIAFIGTSATASASELVINSMAPYLGRNLALIGANTFGKPVGQIALDRSACDDRIRVVAFSSVNSRGRGDYFNGLASTLDVTCQAADDLTRPLGDPQEASIRGALDFLAGRSCTAITLSGPAGNIAGQTQRGMIAIDRQLLVPDAPSPAQREVPGLF
ncbi:peptidase S41-like protein [Blastomonas natatoria]|uniref:Peptidase S41-like protein n=1 Tax=Blastomonas natatoria TaxID=34015 RepID=A0A2V3VC42_9SPHN|nr:S41 family peptidase [Blastomonas natatoria]PXW79333.1 peptidase S41-like protein [Blastomonas natatoria]